MNDSFPGAFYNKAVYFNKTCSFFLISILFMSCIITITTCAADSNCDPFLKKLQHHPYPYTQRDDRCEGIYIKEIGCTVLSLASLTGYFENYNLDSTQNLLLEWISPNNTPVTIRAQGIRHQLYYRMDTTRPDDSTSYSWPAKLLAALRIAKKDLGIICSTEHSFDSKKREVYLPLRVTQKGSDNQQDYYRLIVVPGVDLWEVFLSISSVDENGHLKKMIKDGEPLEYGYYPAGRKIIIPITGFKDKGFYYIEISAELRSGGDAVEEFYFYHADDK